MKMEQFKDIERENKTKPHSKQGLSAEEKLDPREKEKAEAIEWFKVKLKLIIAKEFIFFVFRRRLGKFKTKLIGQR